MHGHTYIKLAVFRLSAGEIPPPVQNKNIYVEFVASRRELSAGCPCPVQLNRVFYMFSQAYMSFVYVEIQQDRSSGSIPDL
jgi:hypothetical protein